MAPIALVAPMARSASRSRNWRSPWPSPTPSVTATWPDLHRRPGRLGHRRRLCAAQAHARGAACSPMAPKPISDSAIRGSSTATGTASSNASKDWSPCLTSTSLYPRIRSSRGSRCRLDPSSRTRSPLDHTCCTPQPDAPRTGGARGCAELGIDQHHSEGDPIADRIGPVKIPVNSMMAIVASESGPISTFSPCIDPP